MWISGVKRFYGYEIHYSVELVSLNSFGVPYLVPWASFNVQDFIGVFIDGSITDSKRLNHLQTKDKKDEENSYVH